MFLYVYSPSDFVSGLPIESGASADGVPIFTLTLVAGATPTLIEVTDDDLVFDEVDGSQVLTNAVTIDGNAFAAGTSINTAYDLINSASGHKVTSFHFGGDGYQQGAVDGLVSTVPLIAGTSYSFDTERTSHQQNNEYQDYVACFVTGALIETDKGPKPVEALQEGDLLMTLDRGYQPVLAVLSQSFDKKALEERPKLRPVRIRAGALGQELPERDLLVSPQHRFLARSSVVKRMFGEEETLLSATQLASLPGIRVDQKAKEVTYFHLVMAQHEILFAEGSPTESFYCGPMAMGALAPKAHQEILEIFPELAESAQPQASARIIPSNKRQKRLVRRHRRNDKPILGDPVKGQTAA
ncbi:Hint domain-containing protein [Sulfitobacter donghicola]|uniref:Type I secretion protein n=1 Tax=Sulfitobacter donghicola DSW-25 = KCTC 12864 = JCM 14565 TaxID=1300350 RepID=A0A073IIY4_9RHOB|nr:Hint domain-containing protein [Sulfitobacter donghicola]KEJ89505.1 type I secretion protein [Sulfitobacter donghicola DSW-25 = KCTC 12864 = JCM 14565]KIN69328.1 Type I secretion target repeat protein [Sulfitobacter donghicola DSW-25 = KCTC 12864 = JCM 14565]